MVNYNCNVCNYITIRKSDYNRHIGTKKHLMKTNNYDLIEKHNKYLNINSNKGVLHNKPQEKNIKKNLYECKHCFIKFTRIDSLNRHILKYCKLNKLKEKKETLITHIDEYTKQREYNKKEKDKLYDYIDKLINKKGNTNIIINNQMNNKINLNNIRNEEIYDDYMRKHLYGSNIKLTYKISQVIVKMKRNFQDCL